MFLRGVWCGDMLRSLALHRWNCRWYTSASPLSSLPLSPPLPHSPALPSAAAWHNLRAGLRAGLLDLGVRSPTAVQAAALPAALAGRHVLITSATGEGKTLAFLLPLLHNLKSAEVEGGVVTRPGRPRALVLVPTRELALQVLAVAKALCHREKFVCTALVGGRKESLQRQALARPVDLVVATTGRLLRAVTGSWCALTDVSYCAIDEVDTMVCAGEGRAGAYGGFESELLTILRALSPVGAAARASAPPTLNGATRSTLNVLNRGGSSSSAAAGAAAAAAAAAPLSALHSSPPQASAVQFFLAGATIPPAAAREIARLFPGAHTAATPTAHTAPKGTSVRFIPVSAGDPAAKHEALLQALPSLLRSHTASASAAGAGAAATGAATASASATATAAAPTGKCGVLVFCNSVASARSTALTLGEAGYACASLHGDMPPSLRGSEYVLFASGQCPVLVATDSAARGLDFGGGVAAVLLFDFPRSPVEYLHRIGRTGRGVGGRGQVVALVGRGDAVLAKAIERESARGGDISALSSDKYDYVAAQHKEQYKRGREGKVARWGGRGGKGYAGGAGGGAQKY